MPYAVEDAPFFFGREPERELIAANLLASRLTILYGESGVGKTSVLNAGVVHDLRALIHQNRAAGRQPEFAVVIFNSWRDDPIAGLASCVRTSIDELLGGDATGTDPLPDGLVPMLQVGIERTGCEFLIILDQFEEYFLYHGEEHAEKSFRLDFPKVVNNIEGINILVSIREDALAKLDLFKGRIPSLFDNYLRVDHLERQAARLAVTRPVDEFNKRMAVPGRNILIEPALVDAILEQIGAGNFLGALGGIGVGPDSRDDRIEAPVLQLVMSRLWDEEMRLGSDTLRLETLEKRLGGAQNIIRTHLDEAMGALTRKEQDIAAGAFHFLVTPSGSKIAHTVADLAQYSSKSEAQLTPVLAKLSQGDARVLRPVPPPPNEPGSLRYEIFHDVLAPSILDWRLRHLEAREWTRRFRRRLVPLGLISAAVALALAMVIGILLHRTSVQYQELNRKRGQLLRSELAVPGQGVIAFHKSGGGDAQIYVMRPDGSAMTQLTHALGGAFNPAWSADGKRLAFMSKTAGQEQIFVMNADGSGETNLSHNSVNDSFPAWSPDGKQIAFRSRRDGPDHIYIMNADGSGQRPLTNTSADDTLPSWSPDGKEIAFARDASIYKIRADGSGLVRLTNSDVRPGEDYSPDWSPDGKRIAFKSSRAGKYQVYVMNADGSHQRRLTRDSFADEGPSWSPDGRKLAFKSDRSGEYQVYVMYADGLGQTQLTYYGGGDVDPAWGRG
jgi:sugar lactone lactonase YvrE